MASTSPAAAAGSSKGSADDTLLDRLGWFLRPDTNQWWPSYYYPSHAAFIKDYPLCRIQNVDQKRSLLKTYMREVIENVHLPAVRVLGVEPKLFFTVTNAAAQLAQCDFGSHLIHTVMNPTLPEYLTQGTAMKEAAYMLEHDVALPATPTADTGGTQQSVTHDETNAAQSNKMKQDEKMPAISGTVVAVNHSAVTQGTTDVGTNSSDDAKDVDNNDAAAPQQQEDDDNNFDMNNDDDDDADEEMEEPQQQTFGATAIGQKLHFSQESDDGDDDDS